VCRQLEALRCGLQFSGCGAAKMVQLNPGSGPIVMHMSHIGGITKDIWPKLILCCTQSADNDQYCYQKHHNTSSRYITQPPSRTGWCRSAVFATVSCPT